MSIGNRIKLARKQAGLSVDELAVKLNKDRATIYRYESGQIENLPLTILEPLAKVLNVTSAYLMGWEKESEVITLDKKTKTLLTNYNKLNDVGKKEAIKRIDELTHIEKYSTPSHLMVNAANEIEGSSEEDKNHDDAIMDDENF